LLSLPEKSWSTFCCSV